MKYAFLVIGIMDLMMFAISTTIKLTTGEVTDWHYTSQITGLLGLGIFLVLDKLDKLKP